MQFQETALFLDHQNRRQALRKFASEPAVERERHTEFRDANSEPVQLVVTQTKIAQSLREIIIGFPGAGDPEPRFVLSLRASD